MSKNTKTKIVLDEEPEKKEEKKQENKEEFKDYLFRFGKYKNMLCSQVVSIETINPKTKQKQQQGLQYLQWCLKQIAWLSLDDKNIIQEIIDNYLKK